MHCHPQTLTAPPWWVHKMQRRGRSGGPGPMFGPFFGPGGGGRPRRRRGDVRAAILLLLDAGPMNGYALMQEVEERSGGDWRPSPGSVYPTLSQLEDEGLVDRAEDKAFSLTDAGKAHVEENRDKLGAPWSASGGEGLHGLRQSVRGAVLAATAVGETRDEHLAEQATEILDETRKRLYALLAADEDTAK